MSDKGMGIGNIVAPAIGAGLGLVLGEYNDKRQREQQKKLQDIQIRGQKEMTDYNAGTQLDMWNKTNAEAQMKHLKNAGLNAGLMYGGGGAGGSTISGGASGNVTGGSAPQGGKEVQEGLGLAMQMKAQTELLQAQKENLNADTQDKLANLPVKGATKGNIEADTGKKGVEKQNLELSQNVIRADTALRNAQASLANTQGRVAKATAEDEIEIKAEEAIGARLDNALTKAKTAGMYSQINVNNQQIHTMKTQIAQKYMELTQNQQRIGIEGIRVEVEKFSKEMQAKYPSMWNVVGKSMTDFFKGMGATQYEIENN